MEGDEHPLQSVSFCSISDHHALELRVGKESWVCEPALAATATAAAAAALTGLCTAASQRNQMQHPQVK